MRLLVASPRVRVRFDCKWHIEQPRRRSNGEGKGQNLDSWNPYPGMTAPTWNSGTRYKWRVMHTTCVREQDILIMKML
jgi:hypothetical protein